jgi:hypothetical protein
MTLSLGRWPVRRVGALWGAGLLIEAGLLLAMFALLVRPEPPLVAARPARSREPVRRVALAPVRSRRLMRLMGHSFRRSVLIAGAVLGACVRRPPDVDVEDAGRGTPYRIFPELPTWSVETPWAGGSVPPTPEAPPCAAAGVPEADWLPLRARTSSRWVTAVSVRLPARFVVRDVPDISPNAEENGGILVGTWTDTTQSLRSGGRVEASLSVWVGPEPGYPTVGADTATRQVAVAECTSARPVQGTRLVTFTLIGPRGTQRYLDAVWPVATGRYLRVMAAADQPEDAAILSRAFASIVVESRTASPAR